MAKHRAELDETQVDVQLRETEQCRAVLACADNIIMPIIAAETFHLSVRDGVVEASS